MPTNRCRTASAAIILALTAVFTISAGPCIAATDCVDYGQFAHLAKPHLPRQPAQMRLRGIGGHAEQILDHHLEFSLL